jgi:Amt family ammonium transporter
VVGASGGGLRVGEEEELGGLDLSEHGKEAYPEFVSTTNV